MIDRERGGDAFRRLGPGEAIMLVCGVLLFALTFFQWYGRPHSGPNALLIDIEAFGGGTAWQTLAVVQLLAVSAACAVAIGKVLLELARPVRKSPVAPGAVVCAFGLLAVIAILAGIHWPPETKSFPATSSVGAIPMEQAVLSPVFLALAAALGISLGGLLTMRRQAGVGVTRPHLESAA